MNDKKDPGGAGKAVWRFFTERHPERSRDTWAGTIGGLVTAVIMGLISWWVRFHH